MEQGGRAPVSTTARRLFFALWPDAALRRAIANLAGRLPSPRGTRLTRPERYHLTVLFLGDFDRLSEPVLAAIQSAADSVRARRFELSLDHFDSFAGSRVGWLGPRTSPGGLMDLHDALDVAVRTAGVTLKPSTTFVPHVTVQRNLRIAVPAMDVSPVRWPVSDFVLIESLPGSVEPYRIVGAWPLVRP